MALVRQQRYLSPGLPAETRHSYSTTSQFRKGMTLKSARRPSLLESEDAGGSMSDRAIDTLSEHLDRSNPLLVAHVVFHYAGLLFGSLMSRFKSDRLLVERNHEDPVHRGPVEIPVRDGTLKKEIYDLAFETLKYQGLLEEMLLDSGFYSYDMIPDENHHPTMVILCHMVRQHFVIKRPKVNAPSTIPYIQELEESLFKHTVKLNAALARNRIKFQARSIEHLLPERVREREECSSRLPTYTWVNQLKISVPEAMDYLREEGFHRVSTPENLHEDSFLQDENCPDVIAFPPGCRGRLEETSLVTEGQLIIQDKMQCLGPHSLVSLLSDGDDVIHVGVGSGLTTAHLATLVAPFNSTLYGFGLRRNDQLEHLQEKAHHLGITNVKFSPDDFLEVQPTDGAFKNVKAILVTPPDSRSGVVNPVEFIMQEGEDLNILKEMSQESVNIEKVGNLVANQMDLLKHAMKFPKVQVVVYATLSTLEEENENVVTKSVEYVNLRTPGTKSHFKIVSPTLPLTPRDLECNDSSSRFLKIAPSTVMGGCFVAAISRQDEALSASDILARAAAKGLYSPSSEGDRPSETVEEAVDRKMKRKSKPRQKQRSIQKLIRSSKSTPITEAGHGHHSNGKPGTSPTRKQGKKSKPTRASSTMFAHHFEGREQMSEPKIKLQPYGVPLTQLALMRQTPKVELVPPHKTALDHPKPFI